MSLFEGSAPSPVELEKTSETKVPDYLTNYLTSLSQAGLAGLGTVTPGAAGAAPTVKPFTGQELIAAQPQFLQNLMTPATGAKLPTLSDLTRYQSALTDASTVGGLAKEVSATDISKFYDPYEADVINKLAEQSTINTQRNLLPALRSAFAGSGGFGGQRYASAISQGLGDVQTGLLAKQAELRSAGYKQALEAALREQATQQGLVGGLSSLGSAEAQAAPAAIKQLADIGSQKLAYDQSKIEAPVIRARNIAEIMRGYQYPTTVSETKEELPTVMSPSALSQIAGLGTLVGAVDKSAASGLLSSFLKTSGSQVPSGYTSWDQYFELNPSMAENTPG